MSSFDKTDNDIDSMFFDDFTLLQGDFTDFDSVLNHQGPGSDADCEGDSDHDIDDDDVPPSQPTSEGIATATVFQNDVQNPEGNVGASTPVPTESGEPVEVVDEEELRKWQTSTLKNKEDQIKNKEEKINELSKKAAAHQKEADKKQADHDREHARKEMGQYKLNQILKLKNNAQKQATNRKKELDKVNNELQNLRNQIAEINANPLELYLKDKKPIRKRKSSKEKNNHIPARPKDYDPDSIEGDDSLSENEEFIKLMQQQGKTNAKIACRRCKLGKAKCEIAPGQSRCAPCIEQNGRCRFNDPVFSRQIPKDYLDKLHESYKDLKAQLDEHQKTSLHSVWSNNPLSGITGYGPSSPRIAEQNFWLMSRGMDPIYGAPGEKKKKYLQLAGTGAEKKKQEENSEEPQSKKRKANSEGDISISDDTPLTKRHKSTSSDNRQQETSSIPQIQGSPDRFNLQQVENQGGQVVFNGTTAAQHFPLPQTHGIIVNGNQLNHAHMLARENMVLPVHINHVPIWPPYPSQ